MIYDESIIKEDIKKLEAREFYIKYIIKTNNWYFEKEPRYDCGIKEKSY